MSRAVIGADGSGGESPRRAAAPVRPVDPELLEAALAAEGGGTARAAEFRACLAAPVLSGLGQPDARAALTLDALSGQRAQRFPAASGDPEWLTARSMGVVARRLAPALAAAAAVCLDVTRTTRSAGSPVAERAALRMLCDGLAERLPPSLGRLSLSARELSFSLRGDHAGLGELLRLRGVAALGRPQVVVRVPDRLMLMVAGDEPAADAPWGDDPRRHWHGLTELAHRDAGIALVLEHTTRPASALAADERPDAVLPRSLFEVGAGTAWLAVRLDLAALGPLDRPRLVRAQRLLRAGLRLADNLVEQVDWGAPETREDAGANRRLALHVGGLGDLVDACGFVPSDFRAVQAVQRWVGALRRLLVHESAALAAERGPFPGLALRDLEATLSRRYGAQHAERMLRRNRLRHRHLLVLSPFSVFPARPVHPLPAYLHLLPALRHADTVGMHGHELRRALPLATYRRLLQMTWAIARNRP